MPVGTPPSPAHMRKPYGPVGKFNPTIEEWLARRRPPPSDQQTRRPSAAPTKRRIKLCGIVFSGMPVSWTPSTAATASWTWPSGRPHCSRRTEPPGRSFRSRGPHGPRRHARPHRSPSASRQHVRLCLRHAHGGCRRRDDLPRHGGSRRRNPRDVQDLRRRHQRRDARRLLAHEALRHDDAHARAAREVCP